MMNNMMELNEIALNAAHFSMSLQHVDNIALKAFTALKIGVKEEDKQLVRRAIRELVDVIEETNNASRSLQDAIDEYAKTQTNVSEVDR